MGLFCSSLCPGATGRRSALAGVVCTAAVAASVINRCRCERRGRSIDRSIDLVMLLDRMVSLLGRSISLLCRSACGSISRRRRRSPTRCSTHSRRSTRTTTTRRTAARAAATTPRPRSCLRRALTMGLSHATAQPWISPRLCSAATRGLARDFDHTAQTRRPRPVFLSDHFPLLSTMFSACSQALP